MALAPTRVSVEEYLHNVYKPDVDYVDGEILERNMAEADHGRVQGLTVSYFVVRRKDWNIIVLLETRVQVKPPASAFLMFVWY